MHGVRVLSIPAVHPYVQHIGPPTDADEGEHSHGPAQPWRPSPALDPDWLRDHRHDFDLVHLHFGFEALTIGATHEWLAALASLQCPLVYTVHDLTNPHLLDQRHHSEQVALLVRAADALITLTPGAARVIAERWSRDALVLPHPHVAPLPVVARPRPPRGPNPVIGLHLKSLRPSTDSRAVAALLDAVNATPDTVFRVDVHEEAMRADFVRHDTDLTRDLTRWADEGRLRLAVHPRFSDDQLWDYLQCLDVAVLPYRSGTHSGWVEACHDVGTAVVAPAMGFWAEQQPVWTYRTTVHGPVVASLADAVTAALAGPAPRAAAAARLTQRQHLAEQHDRLYQGVLA